MIALDLLGYGSPVRGFAIEDFSWDVREDHVLASVVFISNCLFDELYHVLSSAIRVLMRSRWQLLQKFLPRDVVQVSSRSFLKGVGSFLMRHHPIFW